VSVLDRPFASFSVGVLRGQQTVDHPTKKSDVGTDAQETAGGTGEMDDINHRHPRARINTAKGINPTSGAARCATRAFGLSRHTMCGTAPEGRTGSGTSPRDEIPGDA
jgi:hypothetical protein